MLVYVLTLTFFIHLILSSNVLVWYVCQLTQLVDETLLKKQNM